MLELLQTSVHLRFHIGLVLLLRRFDAPLAFGLYRFDCGHRLDRLELGSMQPPVGDAQPVLPGLSPVLL